LAGCGLFPSEQIAATATHTVIPATDTPIPTSTSTPTPPPTPTPTKIYQPSPRWMMLNQAGYSAQILGEEWRYYEDDWNDEYACTNYQNNDYERWFEQCFAYSSSISYDEILAPFLEKGFEALEPLRREGNTYTAFYSLDGQSCILIGVHRSPITPVSFGLLIGRSDQPISADFDFYEIYSLP